MADAAGLSAGKGVRKGDPSLPIGDMSARDLLAVRDLFWHNVVREMLGALAVVAEKHPQVMDGRFAVLTHRGERIPIGRVEPVFAYTMRDSRSNRRNSTAVQQTVFRVATPEGEVFTLPVQEIRGFHELTPELLAQIQQAEEEQQKASGASEPPRPFGFAAFAALPKGPEEAAPDDPKE